MPEDLGLRLMMTHLYGFGVNADDSSPNDEA
jgi:hypothetical protein